MNSSDYFKLGQLRDAIAAATEDVKRHPAEMAKRWWLAELLCFAGEIMRADAQLEVLGQQDPQAMLGISLFRQLIRAEQARQQFFGEGRLPEMLDQPTPALSLCLEASIRLREKSPAEAAELLQQAEERRPHAAGVCNGRPFDDFRDVDDLVAPVFEVLTSTGKYYWIPIERVESLELRAPERPRDLLWRPARMVVSNGPDGEVYLPTVYAADGADVDDQARLGRVTEWRGEAGEAVRGVGQRLYLVGDDGVPIMDVVSATFQGSPAAS